MFSKHCMMPTGTLTQTLPAGTDGTCRAPAINMVLRSVPMICRVEKRGCFIAQCYLLHYSSGGPLRFQCPTAVALRVGSLLASRFCTEWRK